LQQFLPGRSDPQAFDGKSNYRDDGSDKRYDAENHQHRKPILKCADSVVAVVAVSVIEIKGRQVHRSQGYRFVFTSRAAKMPLPLPDESVRYIVSEFLSIVGPLGAVVLDQ